MKILITGGAGYVGTELVYRLAAHPGVTKILLYDNLSRKNYNLFIGPKVDSEKIEFVRGELLDSRKLRQVLKGVDVVYHLAAKVSTPFANEDPHLFEQVNHWGTAELVYAIEESSVKKLVYLSSTSIYGASKNNLDINTVPNPRTFYGISKLRGEEHVERVSNKLPVYILRCGNIYGYSPSMRFDAVINRFVFEANFHGRISIHGDGKQGRAFIHISKVTDVLANLISAEGAEGKYNLVDKNVSVVELSHLLKQVFPEMEMIFVNQHLSLRGIHVERDENLAKICRLKETDLLDELHAFKDRLAFTSSSQVPVA